MAPEPRQLTGRAWLLDRYVGAEFLVSFSVAFAFFFFMFFVNQLLLLAEDILQKDVPFWDVVRLIIYSLPSIIALSVPFGTLVGTLMAVGRLSSDSEIVAFRASGFSLRRVFTPILLLSFVLSGASFFTNDYLLPLGTLNFGRLYRELLYANPALELEPYSVKRYQNDVLITGAVEPGRIDSLTIIDTDGQGNRRVISAAEARLIRDGDPNAISLELSDVSAHSAVSAEDFTLSEARIMRYNILLEDITVAIRSPGPREMSARDVRTEIRAKEAALEPRLQQWQDQLAELDAEIASQQEALTTAESAGGSGSSAGTEAEAGAEPEQGTSAGSDAGSGSPSNTDQLGVRIAELRERRARVADQRPFDRSLQVYRLEYHKKFSIPFAAVSFVLLAFPLGLFTRRSGRTVGFGIGLLIATAYWSMLIAGQTFGTQRPEFPPALAMWYPNVIFLVAGLLVFLRRARQ